MDTIEANKEINVTNSKNFSNLMQQIAPQNAVSDAAAHEFYNTHPYLFSQGYPRVHVREIIVSNYQQAQAILNQIQSGTSFPQLVSQYSIDPENYRKNGGDLGWVQIGSQMPYEWDQAALSLKAKQNSPIITISRSTSSYCILQAIEDPASDLIPYSSLNPPVSITVSQILQQQKFTQWLSERILQEMITNIDPHYAQVIKDAIVGLHENPGQDFGRWY